MDKSPLPQNNGENIGILEELMYNVDALLSDNESVQTEESPIDMETMDALLKSDSNCSEITEIDSLFDNTNSGINYDNCVQKNNETLDDVMNDLNTFLKSQSEGLEENHLPSSDAYVLSDMEDELEMLLGNTAFDEDERNNYDNFETLSETDNDVTKRVFLKARRSLKSRHRSYYDFSMSSDLSPVKQDVISNRLHFSQNPKLDNMRNFTVCLDSTESRHIQSLDDCLQYPVTGTPESATDSGTHDLDLEEKPKDGICGSHCIGAELTEFDNDIWVTIGTTVDKGSSPQQLDEDDFFDLENFGVLQSNNREYLRVSCNVFNSPDRVVNYTQAESQSQKRNVEHADVLAENEKTSTMKTPPKTALLPQTSTPTYNLFQNKDKLGITPLACMKPHINITNISRISSHLSSTCQINADSCSENKFQVVPERNSSAFEKMKEMIDVSDSDEKLHSSTPSVPKELTAQCGKREENNVDTKLVPEESPFGNPNPSNKSLASLEIISTEFLSSGDTLLTGLKIQSKNGVDNCAVSVHTDEIESQNLHICDIDKEITNIKPLSYDNQNVVDMEPHISNSQMTKVENKSQAELSEYSQEENDDDNFYGSEYIVIDETFASPIKNEKKKPNDGDVTDIRVIDMSISIVDAIDDYSNQQSDVFINENEFNTGTKPYLIDLPALQSNLELAPTKTSDTAFELKTSIAIEPEKSDERSEEENNPITCTKPYLIDLSALQSNLELAPTKPADTASELKTNIVIESKIIGDSDKQAEESDVRSVETRNATKAKAVESVHQVEAKKDKEKLNTVTEIDSGYIEGDSKLSNASIEAESRGKKRHISDTSNDEAASKKIKGAKPSRSDVTQDEVRDNTDPRWKLHDIKTPYEGFKHVSKQWRSNPMPRPHDDLTMRWVNQQNIRVQWWKDQWKGRPSDKYERYTVQEMYRRHENDIKNEIRESQNNLFFHMRPQGSVRTINTIKSHLGHLYEVLSTVQAVHPEVSTFYQFYDHGLMTQHQMDDALFQQEILTNINQFYS